MNRSINWAVVFAVVLMALVSCPVYARDLASAAQSAVSTVTTIARAASVLGIVSGALIYQIPGAVFFARGTLISGLIGAALSFGGPGIISFFQSVFGG